MSEEKEENEMGAIKKTLNELYFTEIFEKHTLKIENNVVTILSTNDNCGALKEIIKKLVSDLAETKTNLWIEKFKNKELQKRWKILAIYRCNNCDHESDSFFDLCPKCGKQQKRMVYESYGK